MKIILYSGTTSYEVTQIVDTVTWSGEYTQVARKLEFGVIVNPNDPNIPKIPIKVGMKVKLLQADNKEIFMGVIFDVNRRSSENIFKILAYDLSIYLLKNEGTYKFTKSTPLNITSKICKDFGITLGNVANPDIKVTKKFFGVCLYDIIMTGYTIASKSNGKKYMPLFLNGKLDVIQKGDTRLKIYFDSKYNLIDLNASESLEDMVNTVQIIDKDGNIKDTVSNGDWVKEFGKFQKVYKQEENVDAKTQAKNMLKGTTKKISIEGIGDTTCITGYSVIVKDAISGKNGLFYIDSDNHSWSNGAYSIDLTLNFEKIMDEKESGEDEESKK